MKMVNEKIKLWSSKLTKRVRDTAKMQINWRSNRTNTITDAIGIKHAYSLHNIGKLCCFPKILREVNKS